MPKQSKLSSRHQQRWQQLNAEEENTHQTGHQTVVDSAAMASAEMTKLQEELHSCRAHLAADLAAMREKPKATHEAEERSAHPGAVNASIEMAKLQEELQSSRA